MTGRMDELFIDTKGNGGEVLDSHDGRNVDSGTGIMGLTTHAQTLLI